MTTSPRKTAAASGGRDCAHHGWCVHETVTAARDGSPIRFHHGPPTTVQAGDDTVTIALVGIEDTDAVTYVEVTTTVGGPAEVARPVSVWLTADEACVLLAGIASTIGQDSRSDLAS